MGEGFTIHCKSEGVDSKTIILALNSYLMLPKHFQSCILEMGKLITKLGNIFPH